MGPWSARYLVSLGSSLPGSFISSDRTFYNRIFHNHNLCGWSRYICERVSFSGKSRSVGARQTLCRACQD